MTGTSSSSLTSRHAIGGTLISPQQQRALDFTGPRAECVIEIDADQVPENLDSLVLKLVARHGLGGPSPGVTPPPPSDDATRDPDEEALGPGLRATVAPLGSDRALITLDAPVSIVDAPSLLVLANELLGADAGPLIPYREVAAWQWELLEGPGAAGARQRYAARREAHPMSLRLPFALPSPDTEVRAPWTCAARPVPLGDVTKLDTAPDALFLAAWWALLNRVTGTEDILTAVVSIGRSLPELASVVGPLAKHIPTSANCVGSVGPAALMQRAVAELRASEEWHPNHDPRGPAASVCFEFLRADLPGSARLNRLAAHVEPFELKLTVTGGPLPSGQLYFDTRHIGPDVADHLAEAYGEVLQSLLAEPDSPIARLPFASPAPRGPARPAAQGQGSIVRSILDHAARDPDRLAVVCGNDSLRYRDLVAQSVALAHRMKASGIGPENRVAFELDGSVKAVVALVGILMTGGAYVPLPSGLPEARKSSLLEAVGTRLCLNDDWFVTGADGHLLPLPGPQSDQVLAYVLFTSGSSGAPKPVAVERQQIISYLDGLRDQLGNVDGLTWACVTSLSTDLGNTSVFGALVHGGTLVLMDSQAATDPLTMSSAFVETPVDILKITPSHLEAMLDLPHGTDVLPRRHLILGGEKLGKTLASRVTGLRRDLTVWNHYGPTETTVGCCMHRLDPTETYDAVPLGRPLAQATISVLNVDGQPVPPLVVGELCVGGNTVSRGYLHQPRETAARFVPDISSPEPGGRLYRTGDLGWMDPDGEFHFLRRDDRQLKLRGYRVELGEIETVLVGSGTVAAAAVICHHRRLFAYVVPREGCVIEEAALLEHHRALLPAHMVPHSIRALPTFPRTPSGKIDFAKLTSWSTETTSAGEKPGTELERKLAAIWSEVLGTTVKVDDDFFELGGHSLAAMRISARVFQEFGIHSPLLTLFEARTLRAFAAKIEEAH